MLTSARLVHLRNAPCFIVVIEAGSDMDVSLEETSNAHSPIVVSLEEGGMSMLVRLEQPQNAPSFIVVTDGGNDINVRLVHL